MIVVDVDFLSFKQNFRQHHPAQKGVLGGSDILLVVCGNAEPKPKHQTQTHTDEDDQDDAGIVDRPNCRGLTPDGNEIFEIL